jgi:hypothetical protein
MTTFAVVDHGSNNILGEYATERQAEELLIRLVHADPRVEKDLAIHTVRDAKAPDLAAEVTFERA